MNTDKKAFHLFAILSLVTCTLLLSGCSIFGYEFVNTAKAEANTQVGKIGSTILENEKNNQTAISELIDLYAAQVEQTNEALWDNAILKIKAQINSAAAEKKKTLTTQLQGNLDQKIEPILDNLQAQIKAEKAKIDNNQGGDINQLNLLGAQFSATLAKLVEEKQVIAQEVNQAFDTAVADIISSSLDSVAKPDCSLNTDTLLTQWKNETDAYNTQVNASIKAIQDFIKLKSPIEYTLDGFFGNKSPTDISNTIFNQLKTLAANKITSIQTDVNSKIGTAVNNATKALQSKYDSLLTTATKGIQ